jgi:hypothetical protein
MMVSWVLLVAGLLALVGTVGTAVFALRRHRTDAGTRTEFVGLLICSAALAFGGGVLLYIDRLL